MDAVDDLDDGDKPSKCDSVQSWREVKKNGNLNVKMKIKINRLLISVLFYIAASNAHEALRKRRFEVQHRKKAWFRKVKNKFIFAKSKFSCKWCCSQPKRMKCSIISTVNVVWKHAWVMITDMGIDQLRKNSLWIRS